MKIAVVGAHSCGKTTLAYALASHFKLQDKSVSIITEQARKCPFDLGTIQASKWVLFNTLKEEIEAEKGHEIIVCDRATIDILVYARANGHTLDDYLVTLIRGHMKTYDKVIHLAPSRPIVDDGFRHLDEDYRKKVAQGFQDELWKGHKFSKENVVEFIQELGFDR